MMYLGMYCQVLRGDGLKIMTQLISNTHETKKWSKDFVTVATISLKKKPKAAKCSDHRTNSKVSSKDT